MNTLQELTTRYDSRQSFYGKARVEADYPTVKLWSYDTNVATITYNGHADQVPTVEVYDTYSATTLRHIKEFLKQYGFKAESKAQIENDYMGSK